MNSMQKVSIGRNGQHTFHNSIVAVVGVYMEYLKNGLLLIFKLHFYKVPRG